MLKVRDLNNSEVKESLLVLVFAFLMNSHLTIVTMAFVVFGCTLVIFKLRPPKKVRNVLALFIFGSYWWSYGKVIDPEVGLNFLTTVTILKMMEKETLRDRFMIFFGLLLIISTGSLFEKTLSYVFFFAIAFFILIQDFYQSIGARWKIGEMLKALAWVLPLTGLLFFMAPRSMSPMPFHQGTSAKGEIGYTSDLNISQVESLTENNNSAFEVQLSRRVPNELLYWRGNSINFTDGWNWVVLSKTYPAHIDGQTEITETNGIRQTYRATSREDYYFTLDHPLLVATKGRVFSMDTAKSFPQGKSDWAPRYEVLSSLKSRYETSEAPETYIRTPLKRREKEWIHARFQSEDPAQLLTDIKMYFSKNGFSYSLSPGKIESFQEFMEKKTGFCSHFASAVALILRVKKVPARVVSGFMGGTYNPYADYYSVSQNDAHVWVEYLAQGRWSRVDPTGWLAPTRLSLGGEAFMITQNQSKSFNFLSGFGWYYDMRMWLGQWDFKFYQWLEEMDYQFQETWIQKMRLKRQWVYTIAVLTLVFFMLLYLWSLNRKEKKFTSPHQELWNIFLDKIESRGLTLNPVSLEEARAQLKQIDHKDKDLLLRIWDKLVKFSFAGIRKDEGANLLSEIKRL